MEHLLQYNQVGVLPAANAQVQVEKMASTSTARKYTVEQIRFVLTLWKDNNPDEIGVQFRARFGMELNRKQAKYIKETYVKKPGYIEEFGHLMTERQRARALLEEQAKQNPPPQAQVQLGTNPSPVPVPLTKENPPIQSDHTPAGFPTVAASPQLNGSMTNNQYRLVGGPINVAGLGIRNLPTGYTLPKNLAVSQPERPNSRESSGPMTFTDSTTFQSLGTPTAASTPKANPLLNTANNSALFQELLSQINGQSPNVAQSPMPSSQLLQPQSSQGGNGYAQWSRQGSATAQAQQRTPTTSPAQLAPQSSGAPRTPRYIPVTLPTMASQGAGTATARQSAPIMSSSQGILSQQRSGATGLQSRPLQGSGAAMRQQASQMGPPARRISPPQSLMTNSYSSQQARNTVFTTGQQAAALGSPAMLAQTPRIAANQRFTPTGSPSSVRQASVSPSNYVQMQTQNPGAALGQLLAPSCSSSSHGRASVSPPDSVQMQTQNPGVALGQPSMILGSPLIRNPGNVAGRRLSTSSASPLRQMSVSPPDSSSMPPQNPGVAPRQQLGIPSSPSLSNPDAINVGGQRMPNNTPPPLRQTSVSPLGQNPAVAPSPPNMPTASSSPSKQASVTPQNQLTFPKPQPPVPKAQIQTQSAVPTPQLTMPKAQSTSSTPQLTLPKAQRLTLPRASMPTQAAAALAQSSIGQQAQGAQQAQGSQRAQGIQEAQDTQQAQGPQKAQGTRQSQGTQPAQGIQPAQGAQQTRSAPPAPGIQQAQATHQAQSIQRAQATQQAQGVQQTRSAPSLQQRQGFQQQSSVTTTGGTQKTHQRTNSQNPSSTSMALPPHIELGFGLDPSTPLPIPTFSPEMTALPENHYDTFEDDDFPKLPDTIMGEHFQHHLYDNFAYFPWSEPVAFETGPVVDLPRVVNHVSLHTSSTTTNNQGNSSGRKRKATADSTPAAGDGTMDSGDSERATKRRNLGDSQSLTTSTTGNTRD